MTLNDLSDKTFKVWLKSLGLFSPEKTKTEGRPPGGSKGQHLLSSAL